MRLKGSLLFIWILIGFVCRANDSLSWVEYVNPLIGTQSSFEFSAGNTYPAIARPWGMNFWTPQTGKMGDGWQYKYTANKICGFKQTHQPSPWINDYGQFSLMPIVGSVVFEEEKRSSWFSHKSEIVKPHYYRTYLADHDVLVELTPTERAALFRFTFPKNEHSYIVIDAFHRGDFSECPYIRIDHTRKRIVGYTTRNSGGVPSNFKNYFVIEFDKDFTYKAIVTNNDIDIANIEGCADHVGAIIGFSTQKGELVHARVASSFISEEQAILNLSELGNGDFDELVDAGRKSWNEMLGRVQVEDTSLDRLKTFYSCLYRSLLFPRKLYEKDCKGNIIHYSPYNGKVLSGYMYTDTGFWDTFRSLFPLLNLLYPDINQEIQAGLMNVYKESGFFPEWASPGHRNCMVGNNSASVLVDAYFKGIKFDDLNLLYEGLVHGCENEHPDVSSTGRLGYKYYNELGYIPYDVGIRENAARTLEYAYNDWCIYKLAKALGRPEKEVLLYGRRAMNYQNLFDRNICLMRGKNINGTFAVPFSPLKWGDAFTEGNSWHYTWSVFHDPQGLINLMGGEDKFVEMLDSVFTIPPCFDASYYGQVIHEIREMTVMNMGNYAHGNQPIQHMIYLYNYAGRPWKAQYWLRQVMERMYSCTPDGYCGDEDNGQTSAWYVFSALGFYPVCPGSTQYVLGSPLFRKVTVSLQNGRQIIISAPNNTFNNVYIDSMKLNGKLYTKNYLDHSDLLAGAMIELTMSSKPNFKRGIAKMDYPYSFSLE